MLPAASAPGDPLLVDEALERGCDVLGYGKAAAMVDFDGDGLLDLFVTDHVLPNTILEQQPDHTFADATNAWGGPFVNRATWGVLATDFDDDGDPDIYLSNGGFIQAEANQLLRNDLSDGGLLVDVSAQAGDADLVRQSHGGTVLDYDRDGDLDLFVCNDVDTACSVLRNDGGLVFADVSAAAGVTQEGDHLHATSGDYDNDGWIDVGVGNFDGDGGGGNRLYHNNGDATFTDVAPALMLSAPGQNFGLVLVDLDNDGWQDVYIPRYQTTPTGPSLLARNNGDGTFTNVTPTANMTGQTDMGHNAHDVDGDGVPEIYVGTGNPHFADADLFWRVTTEDPGSGPIFRVEDASVELGIAAQGDTRSHGSVFGDFDLDGDIDLYSNLGGMGHSTDQMENNALWVNQGNGTHWVAFDMTGTLSSRSPVGARAVATTASGREVHRMYRVGVGFCNTDSPLQHFGLAGEDALQDVRITWPSGVTQTLLAPETDRVHSVAETGLRLLEQPTIGEAVSIDVCGTPGHTAAVYFSAATIAIPLPEFGGFFHLSPPFEPVGSVALDVEGVGTLGASVPDNAALVGLEFYLQSFTFGPALEGLVLSDAVGFLVL